MFICCDSDASVHLSLFEYLWSIFIEQTLLSFLLNVCFQIENRKRARDAVAGIAHINFKTKSIARRFQISTKVLFI